jgi:hypothetical protein
VESEAQNIIRDEFGRDCNTPQSFALYVPDASFESRRGVGSHGLFETVDSYLHVL